MNYVASAGGFFEVVGGGSSLARSGGGLGGCEVCSGISVKDPVPRQMVKVLEANCWWSDDVGMASRDTMASALASAAEVASGRIGSSARQVGLLATDDNDTSYFAVCAADACCVADRTSRVQSTRPRRGWKCHQMRGGRTEVRTHLDVLLFPRFVHVRLEHCFQTPYWLPTDWLTKRSTHLCHKVFDYREDLFPVHVHKENKYD